MIITPLLASCGGTALFIANTLAALDDHQVERGIRYGDSEDERLDLYLPATDGERPVIVFFYGGCWGACLDYKREDYEFIAQAFTAQGYIVAVPDYRHYPDVLYEDIMLSATRALDWVRQHAANYGGDGDRILLSGHSAGAHMAAMLLLDRRWLGEPRPDYLEGFIGFAGPYDFLPFTEDYQHVLFGPEDNYAATQPINFVDGDEPPMLLLHGLDDTRVRPKNTRNLAAKLRDFDTEVDAVFYENMNHTDLLAAISRPLRDSEPVMKDIRRYLERVLPAPRIAPS